MRIDRRGSVTIEMLMIIPVAIIMILLTRFILEASLNRQEVSIYARGSAITSGMARSTSMFRCRFNDDAFAARNAVNQTATVQCNRRDAETGLSREQPMWDEVEDGAAPWDEILRDVKPSRSPRDIVARANGVMTLTSPAFLAQQSPSDADQTYLAPENVFWAHDEDRLAEGHDIVIWEELCLEATYQLFPNVFPSAGRPRC
ncbi:MAG: hypothetical protein AAF230_05075 [Pseudomonadota bacterium]